MAVPTIAGISPAFGPPTGGYLVEITGTGFAEPVDPMSLPAPLPYPLPAPARTVEVVFSKGAVSIASEKVLILSDTRIYALVPKWALQLTGDEHSSNFAVDVTVRNRDESEVTIAGEEVTEVDGFSYQQVSLASKTPHIITVVTKTVGLLLRSEVYPNVSSVPSVDHDTNTLTTFIDPARLPQLILLGPALRATEGAYQDWSPYEICYDAGGGLMEVERGRHADRYDLVYKIAGLASHEMVLSNLMTLLTGVINRNPRISFRRDPTNPSSELIELDMSWRIPPNTEQLTGQYSSNIRFFRGDIVVNAVPFLTLDPTGKDNINHISSNIGDSIPTLTIEPKDD